MNDIQQLEMLSESIKNELEDLESLLQHSEEYTLKAKRNMFEKALRDILGNLESCNDSIYGVFEELNANDNTEKLQIENAIMFDILREKLSDEEKLDLKLRHGIEVF